MAVKNEEAIIKELLEKRINLLPDRIIKRRKNRKRYFYAMVLAGLVAVAVGTYTAQLASQIESLKAETEAASYRISLLREQQDQQALIKILEEKIDYKQELLTTLKDQNESVSLILGMVDLSLPQGVYYNSISANNEAEITITGASESYEQVADFIHNLKRTNHFDHVFLENSNKAIYTYSNTNVTVTSYTYSITCSIGGETDEI